jgi:hypothetical protein
LLLRPVVVRTDDIDRNVSSAGIFPFNEQGKAFGCKVVDVAVLRRESEEALSESFDDADPLIRVYAPSEEAATTLATDTARREGWAIVEDWDSLLART